MSLHLATSKPNTTPLPQPDAWCDALRIIEEWKSARFNKESVTQLPTLCASLVPLSRRIGKTADGLQYALNRAFGPGTYRVEQFELHHPVLGNSRTVFYVAPDDMDMTVVKGTEAMQALRECLQGRREPNIMQCLYAAIDEFLGTA